MFYQKCTQLNSASFTLLFSEFGALEFTKFSKNEVFDEVLIDDFILWFSELQCLLMLVNSDTNSFLQYKHCAFVLSFLSFVFLFNKIRLKKRDKANFIYTPNKI